MDALSDLLRVLHFTGGAFLDATLRVPWCVRSHVEPEDCAPGVPNLGRWRMLVAAQRLRESGAPIARIAAEVGYESESTFTRAFRREMGMSPGTFRRQ